MANPPIRSFKMTELKTRLLNPALTSHYQCFFNPPEGVIDWIKTNQFYVPDRQATPGPGTSEDTLNLSISCCDASLPGSTFQTHDVMAYAGVNEKFAYMRAYDDRSDFTFYVNEQYQQLKYFEGWTSFIANEKGGTLESPTYNYRMTFPNNYRGTIQISKFERNFGGEKLKNTSTPTGSTWEYIFKDAYPISIASIPVSYNSSELLKCTVSFTYSRYYLRSNTLGGVSINPESRSPGTTSTSQGVTPSTIGQDFIRDFA